MLKLNKEILNRLYMIDLRKSYPTFPDYALPIRKYSDTTANGLTKCIIDFLNFTGHQAERISSMGRSIDKSKVVEDVLGRKRTIGGMQFIPGTTTNGTADISSVINGKSVKIEVKIGKDRQSQAQLRYQKHIEDAGGFYLIAKSFDNFIEEYRKIITDCKIYISPLKREFIISNKKTNEIQYLDNLEKKIITDKQIESI